MVDIYRACLSPHKTALFDNILKQYVQGLGDFFAAPHQTAFLATFAAIEIYEQEIEHKILANGNEFMVLPINSIQENITVKEIL